MSTKKEQAINNSWFIYQELNRRSGAYHAPGLKFKLRKQKNGKVKVYTEEEIFLYQCRAIKSSFKN